MSPRKSRSCSRRDSGAHATASALFAVDRYPLPEGAKEEIEKPM
jgi:hypothetical protein